MSQPRSEDRHLTPVPSLVSIEEREARLGQRALTVWFTGLSGSGKSTVARALERRLFDAGRAVYALDGDAVRTRLSRDLGFSKEERRENIRRVAEVAHLMNQAGLLVLCSFVSPYRDDRETARRIVGPDRWVEVYVATPLDVCRERDPKGLYRRAETGEVAQFTGVSAPYEEPERPDVTVDTSREELSRTLDALVEAIDARLA